MTTEPNKTAGSESAATKPASNGALMPPTNPKDTPLQNKRRKVLLIIAIVAIVLGIAWLLYHLLVGRWSESTDDAYVQGDVVTITPQVGGTVTRITVGGESGKAGAVIGGIIGAVAGHEISAQTGGSKGNQNISAAAGAVAGAAAGNAIQKNRSDGYTVHVRMDDGRTTAVTQGDVSGFREGSRVRVSDGRAYLQ